MNDERLTQSILYYDKMKEKQHLSPAIIKSYKEKAKTLRELLVYRNAWANIRKEIENKSQETYDVSAQVAYEDCLDIIDGFLMYAYLYEIGENED